ncbi:hypothetical protein ACWKTZ_20970 [Bacillus cereus]
MKSQCNKRLLEMLEPEKNDTWEKESIESYKKRVASLLPNMPECVLENWIHRHYSCVIMDYPFLNFEKMQFIKEEWLKEDIYNNIKSYDEDMINKLGWQIYDRADKTWLQTYMLKHMTWNVPIIILENKENQYVSHENRLLGSPFHLLEGHLRLNYFRKIYSREKENLKETHEIWRVIIK